MTETKKRLPIVAQDPWLEPVEGEMEARHAHYLTHLHTIEQAAGSITDYANGYRYFGFQRDGVRGGWWFREWLPGAREVSLTGDFNGWTRPGQPLARGADGVWSVFLPDGEWGSTLVHGSRIKMIVTGADGKTLERIPAWIRRVVQDDRTKDFTGQLWAPPEPFDWSGDAFDIRKLGPLFIYECHVGMAQEEPRVGTYAEFADNILPRIKKAGYNTVQLMAVAEHPYYGSFGYHVSSFFAPSSRFGTPEELKALVKKAHDMGLAVVMDLVHAHYVKNINEGLNRLDGTDLYSLPGEAGNQPYWDSQLFDYARDGVQHFLLSNAKYWLDEFHFDGFRFDGVTSMIYRHHGYTEFDSRDKYFSDINNEALTYLTLANTLVHEFRPGAVTIAEDVSGMPGMCVPAGDGGAGFDYRLGMAVPDYWIKLLKEVPDEAWNIWEMWNMMTNRLGSIKTVAYCESHDQALVGDKTIAFRLMDKEMYENMDRASQSIAIDRGMALHKMIRLFTLSLAGEAYLNFMGNEFGHPEWIDFPREGNGWSCAHARRQWSLSEDALLRYSFLGEFDRQMLALAKEYGVLSSGFAYNHNMDTANQTVVFSHRGDLLFVFNWHPDRSIPDYVVPVPAPGRYRVVLSTDEKRFGGYEREEPGVVAFSFPEPCADGQTRHYIKIYNICRTAVVLLRVPE